MSSGYNKLRKILRINMHIENSCQTPNRYATSFEMFDFPN